MAKVTIGGRTYEVEVKGDSVVVDGQTFPVTVKDEGAHLAVNAGGIAYRVQLPPAADRASGMQVQVDYRPFAVEYEGSLTRSAPQRAERTPSRAGASAAPAQSAVKGGVTAPIAGKVLRVNASLGASVAAGDVLVVLEAMKMENEIKAISAGTVKQVLVAEGGRVSEGDVLVVVE
jgi:biotin carboxyl carrier protein